jgi:hypothetical protein
VEFWGITESNSGDPMIGVKGILIKKALDNSLSSFCPSGTPGKGQCTEPDLAGTLMSDFHSLMLCKINL